MSQTKLQGRLDSGIAAGSIKAEGVRVGFVLFFEFPEGVAQFGQTFA